MHEMSGCADAAELPIASELTMPESACAPLYALPRFGAPETGAFGRQRRGALGAERALDRSHLRGLTAPLEFSRDHGG